MTRSVRRWRSLTAVAQLPRTACHLLRCHARVLKRAPIPAASTTATTRLKLLTIRLRFRPWQLRDHCLACQRHLSKSVQSDLSTTNQQPDTWMWMRTTMMRAMTRNPPRPSLSAVALAMPLPTGFPLMLPRQLSKSRRKMGAMILTPCSTKILARLYILMFAISYSGFGELGCLLEGRTRERRGNVLPHGDDTLCVLHCLRALRVLYVFLNNPQE
jgi:hypothetical protein